MKIRKISGNKKYIHLVSSALGVLLILLLAVPVMAAPTEKTVPIRPANGNDTFTVTFTKDGKMTDDFTEEMFSLSGLQPGDTAVFQVKVINEYGKETDWYMLNDVLDSLEGKNKAGGENQNKNTSGGAYEYSLTYQGPDDKEPGDIFQSDTVGGVDVSEAGEVVLQEAGNGRVGLEGATDSLKDYFWFDKLAAGESGIVELKIRLEGESQGNNYQDTLADLQMRFAVEIPYEPEPTKPTEPTTKASEETTTTTVPTTTGQKETKKPAQTNDNTGLGLYLFIGCAAALLIIVLCVFALRKRKAAGNAPDGDNKEDRS